MTVKNIDFIIRFVSLLSVICFLLIAITLAIMANGQDGDIISIFLTSLIYSIPAIVVAISIFRPYKISKNK